MAGACRRPRGDPRAAWRRAPDRVRVLLGRLARRALLPRASGACRAPGARFSRIEHRRVSPSVRGRIRAPHGGAGNRSEEHTSELQSQSNIVCRLLLEKKNKKIKTDRTV